MDYGKAVEYWMMGSPTTQPKVKELADWIIINHHMRDGQVYGNSYIKRLCNLFDSTPGAPLALIERGYLIDAEGGWWMFHEHPSFST